MKYRLLRFSLIGIFAMLWGAASAQGPDETITFSEQGYDNGAVVETVKGTDVTLAFHQGTNSNAPKYYTTSEAVRLYGGNTLTVSSTTKTIEKVVFTFAGPSYNLNDPTVDTGTYDGETATWTGPASEFTVTRGGTSGHARIQKMEFYYSSGGQTDTRTATSITLGGDQTGEVGTTMNLPAAVVNTTEGAPVEGATVEWTSSDETVAAIDGTTLQLLKAGTATITAKYAGNDQYKPCQASFTMTVTAAPYTTIGAMLQDVTSTRTQATYQFGLLLVTYVNGSYTFVSDGANAFLFYGTGLGLTEGCTYSGTATGQLYTYNGLPEMSLEATGLSVQLVDEATEISYPSIAPADLSGYVNSPVTIENAVFVKTGTGKNLTFKVGDEEFTVYNQWSVAVGGLETGAAYTLKGIGSVYSRGENTTYQLYLVSFEQEGQPAEDTRTAITLSFPQESYEATMGEDFEEPALTIEPAGFDGVTVYGSSNAEVATISNDGKVTLVAPGTTVISVTAIETELYKGGEASYTLVVKEAAQQPEQPTEGVSYVKVTSADELTDGDYLIVYEEGSVAFNAALETLDAVENTVSVSIAEGVIASGSSVDAATFTIARATGAEGYTVYAPASKKYIGVSSYSNGLKTFDEGVIHAISFDDDGNAVLTVATDGGDMTMRFNSANNQLRFRYYKSGQKPVALYKKVVAEEPQPAEWAWADFAVQLTDGDIFATDVNNFGVKVAQDGSYTATAADDETANFTVSAARFNDKDHGWVNCTFTMRVNGPVLIRLGDCQYGDQSGTITDVGGNVTEIKANATKACWHNDKEKNVVSTYYRGLEPTTLTIVYNGYCPFIAAQAVDPADLPAEKQQYTVSFDIANSGAEGVAPEAVTIDAGEAVTIPVNHTLYKEGYTLWGWSAGELSYATGAEMPVEGDVTLTPVFYENEWNLGEQQEPVTVKWNFRRDQGAPTVAYQNQAGLWVAQATAGGKTIDVKADFDTNNGGKFANGNWTDWAQMNGGTKWTVPSCKGAVVSMEAYSDITTTTIDGQSDYTQGKTISYTIAGAAETVDVVIGDGSYYRYIQVVLPKVEQQGGGETFVDVAGTIHWPVGNEQAPTISDEMAGAISSASVSAGSELTVSTAKYFDTDMVHYTPKTSNAGNVEGVMIEYRVKPAKGVTFKPTQIDYAAVKVGTDAATYSWSYTVDGQESTITQIDPKPDLLRNNGSNSVDNGGTAKLMHTETFANVGPCEEFTFRFYISACANNKNICIGNVTISGIVNGQAVSVNMYELATAVAPEEAGSINVYPVSDQYEEGSELTLTATENFGYDFVNWTNAQGEEVSTEAKFKYTVNSNETLTANFVAVETYELALTVDGTNDYMVKISPEPTIVDGKMMYEAGTAVQLNADQYEGLVTFTNWSDGDTNSSKLVSMTDNVTITAMYAQADIIAGWDFYTAGGSGRKADFYAQDNDGDALNLVNTETGETSGWLDKSTLAAGGYESFKGAAVNWRTGASNGDVGNWHWQTKVNAEAFTDVNVQFQMLYNYNAYQTYDAEFSLDGEQWTKFGSITMSGAKAPASFSEQLPAEANNQAELYIRLLADKTSSVDGSASANDGNTLAMFFITGTPKLVDDGAAPVLLSSVPENGTTGVSASGKIVLTFDERVKLADTFMPTATLGSQTLTPAVNGKTVTFSYKGLEYSTEYTFTLPAGSIADLTGNFIQEDITLSFTTMVRPSVTKGLYDYVVESADDLVAAIAAAQARSDKNTRYRIFIKNGEYTMPLSKTTKTANGYEVPECITFINTQNLSIIGESRDGVVITNGIDATDVFDGQYGKTSKYDGIGNSDVFQISGSDYYFQDLTIESGMADATGRDLAVQDKATRTIYKNTGLRGYQDTWTSNNDNGLYYFEDGYVRGRTDYMCGKGDAFFNGVELRQIAGGYAAVPSKSIKYGFTYKDCVINGEPATVNYATGETRTAAQVDGNYTLGRPWGSGTPVALFINTKMNVVPSAIGWNEMSNGWPKRFAEYNSMTSTGSVIDLSGRKKTFGDGHENNPVLTAEEALEAGNLHNMFGEWDPTLATEQAPIPTNVKVNVDTNVLSWDNSDYALLWAVVKDGKVIDFTIEPKYTVDDATASYAVRAANEMGGLSEASETAAITTAITEVANQEQAVPDNVYNLSGIRVGKAQKGLYIVNGKKVVVK